MPILDCRRGAVFENTINDHRLKSTGSTVYLNNQVENGPFHTDQRGVCGRRSTNACKKRSKFTRLLDYMLHLDNLMRA
jgi:hypothetical protein